MSEKFLFFSFPMVYQGISIPEQSKVQFLTSNKQVGREVCLCSRGSFKNSMVRVRHGKCTNSRLMQMEPQMKAELTYLWVVDGIELERVDSNEDRPDVGVDVASLKAGLEVLEKRLFGQVRQLAKVRVVPVPWLVVQEAQKVVTQ